MAPLELYEKVYVKRTFLDSEHGRIPCEQCHGGNPEDPDWRTAHNGVVKDPTISDPGAVCGPCHEQITQSAPKSLHYTLSPVFGAIDDRAAVDRPETMTVVRQARSRHCGGCHATCGQCHISRPAYVGGGFLSGHHFLKPPMQTVCAACHGGRVFSEFTGARPDDAADVHFEKAGMTCMRCHPSWQIHADGSGVTDRFMVSQRPACIKCHQDAVAADTANRFHARHARNLACQVCHCQANKNCFNCHVGTDKKGLPYFKCQDTRYLFKIGRNPRKTPERPWGYVTLRHAPVTPVLFDAYTPNALPRFDRRATWRTSAPHNIQRRTPRNKNCNGCHGHADLFLRPDDMAEWERNANATVVVPLEKLPQPIKEVP